MRKFRCYIAGKLNSDAVGYIKNMNRMIKTAREIRKLGVAVYVPCNDFLEGIVDGDFEYADYFDNSLSWLLAADFIFVCEGWETSPGTKKEIKFARANNIPVFFDINTLITFLLNPGNFVTSH